LTSHGNLQKSVSAGWFLTTFVYGGPDAKLEKADLACQPCLCSTYRITPGQHFAVMLQEPNPFNLRAALSAIGLG